MDLGIPLFGPKGASNHVREFACALARSGRQVTIITAKLGGPPCELLCQVEPLPSPCSRPELPPAVSTEMRGLAANDALSTILQQVHFRCPVDVVYERYSLWSFAASQFAAARQIPYVLEVNSPLRLEQKKYRELHLEATAAAIEALLFRSAQLIAVVSSEVADYVRAISGRGAPVLILPNGVNLELFQRNYPPAETARFVIGFLGSLKPWHGVECLLQAFRILADESPDYHLLVVGEGPLAMWIAEYSRAHALETRICLTGAVEKIRVPELLNKMHVTVAPYPEMTDFYFSPLKLFEYMAAGRAVVASRIGQIPEIVRDGETGLLTVPGDPVDLAAKIRCLYRDRHLRERLGCEARRESFHHHGWDSRVRAVMELIPSNGTLEVPAPAAVTSLPA